MVQKKVLTPTELGRLTPQWPELNQSKLDRLENSISRSFKTCGVVTRGSCFRGDNQRILHDKIVLSTHPILVSSDGVIINGKHRAYVALKRDVSLEAYVVSSENDIEHHVKKEVIGDMSIPRAVEAYRNRRLYARLCKEAGINTLGDFFVEHM
jgi:hypothetical protein